MNRRKFVKLGACGFLHCSLSPGLNGYYPSNQMIKADNKGIREAKYYKKLPSNKVECLLCPHQCKIADLERGTCGVRENREGKYYTLVYGNLCSMNVDPIEKKPLYHYYPNSSSLSVATAGCNFFCRFCQNWEMSQKRPEQVKSAYVSPVNLVKLAGQKNCKTIAHTYTEPVIFTEYVLDCAMEGKEKGIANIMISNGFINKEPMKDLCKFLGAVKIDLKAFTEEFYVKQCSGNLKPVLDILLLLKGEGIWFEIVVLIIPGLNDSKKELEKMTKWIYKELGGDVPLHFSRYYPTFMMKNIPPTPENTLFTARKIAVDNGIKFAYIGNILNKFSHTYCPSCNRILIERYGYSTIIKGLNKNRCKYCNELIPGMF